MPALSEAPEMISCICPFPIMSGFIERARNCYKAQTYKDREWIELLNVPHTQSVGKLRNRMLETAQGEYVSHHDYDDWSAPDRLEVQLAHLEKTGKLVGGFYDMPLYDQTKDETWIYRHEDTRYALGTSLFYKREAWMRFRFPDQTPEDPKWLSHIGFDNRLSRSVFREDGTPIMIQVIHGRNASARILHTPKYTKAPKELHEHVKEILAKA